MAIAGGYASHWSRSVDREATPAQPTAQPPASDSLSNFLHISAGLWSPVVSGMGSSARKSLGRVVVARGRPSRDVRASENKALSSSLSSPPCSIWCSTAAELF